MEKTKQRLLKIAKSNPDKAPAILASLARVGALTHTGSEEEMLSSAISKANRKHFQEAYRVNSPVPGLQSKLRKTLEPITNGLVMNNFNPRYDDERILMNIFKELEELAKRIQGWQKMITSGKSQMATLPPTKKEVVESSISYLTGVVSEVAKGALMVTRGLRQTSRENEIKLPPTNRIEEIFRAVTL